jgi:hypothetical protein
MNDYRRSRILLLKLSVAGAIISLSFGSNFEARAGGYNLLCKQVNKSKAVVCKKVGYAVKKPVKKALPVSDGHNNDTRSYDESR